MCYLLETQFQHLGIVLGNLGVIDHSLDQLFLTRQSAVMGHIGHGVLVLRSVGGRDLETGCADKDVLSSLLGSNSTCAVRFAFDEN